VSFIKLFGKGKIFNVFRNDMKAADWKNFLNLLPLTGYSQNPKS